MVPQEVAQAIARKTDIGDWWILYMLGRNMDPLIYREVITELAKKIETAASNSQWYKDPVSDIFTIDELDPGPASRRMY